MDVYNIDSPRATFGGGLQVAVAAIVIGLVMAAGKATDDEVSTMTLHDAAAKAAAAAATDYFPSAYTLDATEATPHIEAY